MTAARFLRPSRRRAAASGAWLCLLPLAACAGLGAERAGEAAGPSAEPSAAAEKPSAVSPDLVPEPAVFEATGTARWDGRRTLQGVWVAHPQASSTRRVRIFNDATGAAADGALFTREPTLGGPSVLVSSDAAALLGMTPGVEAELRIVALARPGQSGPEAQAHASGAAPRRAAGLAGAAKPAASKRAAPKPVAPKPVTPKPAAAKPAAALAAQASTERPAAPAPAIEATGSQAATKTPAVEASRPVAAATVARPIEAAEAFAGAAISPAKAPANSGDGSADASPDASGVAADAPAARANASPAPDGDAAARGLPQQEGSLQAEPPASAAGAPPAAETEPPVGAALAAANPRPAAEGSPPSLDRPYIQAGIFSVPENATRLIGRIQAAGMPAVGRPAQLATGPATRVLAGPFPTAAERDAARRRIQAMGLGDAAPVAR